jgi:hypothetical protein
MLICLAKFALRLADFDEVRSGLNTGEAHQRHAPRETSSKTTGSTPHSSFRDRTAMEPAMSPAESGLASRGMGCLVFCPAKPSSKLLEFTSRRTRFEKRVSRIARTQHIGFGSDTPLALIRSLSAGRSTATRCLQFSSSASSFADRVRNCPEYLV